MQFNVMHLVTKIINMLSDIDFTCLLTGYTGIIVAVSKTLEAIKLYKDIKNSKQN